MSRLIEMEVFLVRHECGWSKASSQTTRHHNFCSVVAVRIFQLPPLGFDGTCVRKQLLEPQDSEVHDLGLIWKYMFIPVMRIQWLRGKLTTCSFLRATLWARAQTAHLEGGKFGACRGRR